MTITQNRSLQHFEATGSVEVHFKRFITSLIINVPIGVTATADFDDSAAAAGSLPLTIPTGIHQLDIAAGKIAFTVTGGTITGIGITL